MMHLSIPAAGEIVGGLLDFLLPPLCLGCGEYIDRPSQVCPSCLRRLEIIGAPYCLTCSCSLFPNASECPNCRGESLLLYSLAEYASPLSNIIIHFKFKGITSPVDELTHLILKQHGEGIPIKKTTCLVPVPLHRSRERGRGYNQAELLARSLASVMDISVNGSLLMRSVKRSPQAKLQFDRRERNIRSVFQIADDVPEPADLILVDDVVTSGATVREASRTLQDAGHRVAAVISIARAR